MIKSILSIPLRLLKLLQKVNNIYDKSANKSMLTNYKINRFNNYK